MVSSVQLRKTLELIAFGSLCANKAKYAEAHAKFEQHWRATRLLSDLERIHPQFYPRPMNMAASTRVEGFSLSDITVEFLTRQDFVELYETLSGSPYPKSI